MWFVPGVKQELTLMHGQQDCPLWARSAIVLLFWSGEYAESYCGRRRKSVWTRCGCSQGLLCCQYRTLLNLASSLVRHELVPPFPQPRLLHIAQVLEWLVQTEVRVSTYP